MKRLYIYWTKELCIEDAKKYKTRGEWGKKSHSAYNAASRNGWIDICCEHMKPKIYWTKELCIEDAKKYNSRSEWQKKSNSAYRVALINDWLDICCEHMTEGHKPKNYWTKERCIEEAKKYKTRTEWDEKSKFTYNVARKNGWMDICCEHMTEGHKKLCIIDAKKYKTRTEWSKKSQTAYRVASRKGWLDICCEHMKKRNAGK